MRLPEKDIFKLMQKSRKLLIRAIRLAVMSLELAVIANKAESIRGGAFAPPSTKLINIVVTL